eukprot:TRINITY_DN8525_c0_g1_i1.p1 TRINITY_DN8525_c0_g1~~TRINITY_DN8525_c0_g1_i1.p1  ORF type:complete len:475 (-),score=155.12 TRINITY_DN8525_c0_g1_i1:20-1444(-)
MVKVSIKWGKQKFDDIELDLNEPPVVFKGQIYALTNVLPERQKIMVKGGMLKDDADWNKLGIKDGHVFMLMGSAEADIPKAPTEKTVFVEDLNTDEAAAMNQALYPAGLENLGNTCYMNATLQCMKAVPELGSALKGFRGGMQDSDTSNNVTVAMRDLFGLLSHSNQSIPPLSFLQVLRTAFPQFAQQANNGAYMQQDAEECWTQILLSLGQKLPNPDSNDKPSQQNSAITKIFGGDLESVLSNDENPDEPKVVKSDPFIKLSCHISKDTLFLLEGLKEGLTEHISKQSESLGREAKYTRTSKISRLPNYLTIQFVRFFWKSDTKMKAKIVKPVEFPLIMDAYELCNDTLKSTLQPNRKEFQEFEEKAIETAKKQKLGKQEEDKMQIDNKDDPLWDATNKPTGQYELFAVLTHKGRMADAGHYVAWVKESNDKWLKFDDDVVSQVNNEEIKKLSGKGGGDWHMAYLVVYRPRTK